MMKNAVTFVVLVITVIITISFSRSIASQDMTTAPQQFVPYRQVGRDPMVSLIIEKKTLGGGLIITPLGREKIPVGRGGDERQGKTRVVDFYITQLTTLHNESQKALRLREYEKVIHYSENALNLLEKIEKEEETPILSKNMIKTHKKKFRRWKDAAEEGIIRTEALEDFRKRGIVLQGIMWDEEQPIAILNGISVKEGDPFNLILIDQIRQRTVNVIFRFKEREFYYTLEFPEE